MKLRTRKHWLLLAAICAAGAAFASPVSRPVKSKAALDDDVREVVFRHLLKMEDASERKFVGFLAVNGNRDPSNALMARFRAFKPPLKKVSKCVREPKSNGHWVKDKGTAKEGIILSVDTIQWLNPQTADVRAGDYVGGRWASSATYHVVWRRGQWVIVGAKDAIRS